MDQVFNMGEVVRPMSNVIYGYQDSDQDRHKASNYKHERRIYRKVSNYYDGHMYLLNKLQKKLNAITCNVSLEVLSEMEAPAIVRELIGKKALVRMLILDPSS